MMLNREEIIELVEKEKIVSSTIIEKDLSIAKNLLLSNFDRRSSFQPGSLDLHVGEIYLPDAKGSGRKMRKTTNIKPGEMALIKTLEKCDFPPYIGGICVAPSSLSLEGVLIMNTGHIDPCFTGELYFTIVNLGKKDKEIRASDIIATMLLYKYSNPLDLERFKTDTNVDDILPRLSSSFMNYEETLDKKITNASLRIPIIVSLLGIIGAILINSVTGILIEGFGLNDKVEKNAAIINEQQTKVDENESIINEQQEKLKSLEKQIDEMMSTINKE